MKDFTKDHRFLKLNQRMERLCNAYRKTYLAAKRIQNPSYEEQVLTVFKGTPEIASSFLGTLLRELYPGVSICDEMVFIISMGMRKLPSGTMGLYPGVWTRQEIIQTLQASMAALDQNPAFFRQEEASVGEVQ